MERGKLPIDEIDKKIPEIPEIDERTEILREPLQVEEQIAGINWLLEVTPNVIPEKVKALKLVRHALRWAMEETTLKPFEVAELFIREKS